MPRDLHEQMLPRSVLGAQEHQPPSTEAGPRDSLCPEPSATRTSTLTRDLWGFLECQGHIAQSSPLPTVWGSQEMKTPMSFSGDLGAATLSIGLGCHESLDESPDEHDSSHPSRRSSLPMLRAWTGHREHHPVVKKSELYPAQNTERRTPNSM